MVDQQDATGVTDVGEGVVLDLADGIYTADWSGMVGCTTRKRCSPPRSPPNRLRGGSPTRSCGASLR